MRFAAAHVGRQVFEIRRLQQKHSWHDLGQQRGVYSIGDQDLGVARGDEQRAAVLIRGNGLDRDLFVEAQTLVFMVTSGGRIRLRYLAYFCPWRASIRENGKKM